MQLCATFRCRRGWPLIVAGILLAGCHAPAVKDLNIACAIQPQPPRVGPADIAIELSDSNGGLPAASSVTVEADMSHPGMAPIFVTARPSNKHDYRAHLNFTMPGDWTLLVQADFVGGRRAEKQLHLTVREK